AAPGGLAASIAAAASAGTTLVNATAASAVMTVTQKALVVATFAIMAGIGIYEARVGVRLRRQAQTLQRERAEAAAQLEILQREKEDLSNQLALLSRQVRSEDSAELLRLRGEVARLRRAADDAVAEARNARAVESAFLQNTSNAPPVRTFTATTM